jgi:hypothetical protein
MEKLLFKKRGKGFGGSFLEDLNPSLFRSATLHFTKRGSKKVKNI